MVKRLSKRRSIKKTTDPIEVDISRVKFLENELQFVTQQRDALRERMQPMLNDAFLFYKQQMGDLLTNEQKAHADAAGVTHDQYAMQLIRLCQLRLDELQALHGIRRY